ncbi:MAG: glycosyltransferase family 4 protein [Solirubrobacteraceae bacterium]
MRVGFLTHYFPPELGAPQTRIELLARRLAEAGHEVTVHTGFPHYPSGSIPAPYRNRPFRRERHGKVSVLRSAVYPAANRGFARRLADHASFALSALATAPLCGELDVLIAESPPLFTAAAGVAYAAGKRAALVVNVADRWPASAVELGALTDQRAVWLATRLERWIYSRAQLITAPTAGLVSQLEEVPEARGKCRRTWPVVDVERFNPAPPPIPKGRQPLRLLYAGTLGLAQEVEVLVRASQIAGPELVQTTIAGDGADRAHVAELTRNRAVDNVSLLGAVAARRIPGLYAEADAAAVLLRDVPLFRRALPTKMFEAMAAGRPVLLCARGEAAELVRGQAAGLVCPPGDPEALAEAIARLQGDLELRRAQGARGRRFAEARCGAVRAGEEWTERIVEALERRPTSARRFNPASRR